MVMMMKCFRNIMVIIVGMVVIVIVIVMGRRMVVFKTVTTIFVAMASTIFVTLTIFTDSFIAGRFVTFRTVACRILVALVIVAVPLFAATLVTSVVMAVVVPFVMVTMFIATFLFVLQELMVIIWAKMVVLVPILWYVNFTGDQASSVYMICLSCDTTAFSSSFEAIFLHKISINSYF